MTESAPLLSCFVTVLQVNLELGLGKSLFEQNFCKYFNFSLGQIIMLLLMPEKVELLNHELGQVEERRDFYVSSKSGAT